MDSSNSSATVSEALPDDNLGDLLVFLDWKSRFRMFLANRSALKLLYPRIKRITLNPEGPSYRVILPDLMAADELRVTGVSGFEAVREAIPALSKLKCLRIQLIAPDPPQIPPQSEKSKSLERDMFSWFASLPTLSNLRELHVVTPGAETDMSVILSKTPQLVYLCANHVPLDGTLDLSALCPRLQEIRTSYRADDLKPEHFAELEKLEHFRTLRLYYFYRVNDVTEKLFSGKYRVFLRGGDPSWSVRSTLPLGYHRAIKERNEGLFEQVLAKYPPSTWLRPQDAEALVFTLCQCELVSFLKALIKAGLDLATIHRANYRTTPRGLLLHFILSKIARVDIIEAMFVNKTVESEGQFVTPAQSSLARHPGWSFSTWDHLTAAVAGANYYSADVVKTLKYLKENADKLNMSVNDPYLVGSLQTPDPWGTMPVRRRDWANGAVKDYFRAEGAL